MDEGRLSVVIRPIANSPELSERIGYLASQQRRAYNAAIQWLNREPNLPLRVSAPKGVTLDRAILGRITQLRQSDATWGQANTPRWVHDAGARLAHLAQQKFADARETRLTEIRRIENQRHQWAANPPRTPSQWRALRQEEARHERLTKPHRRALSPRTRKKGTQTLEVDNNQRISVTSDRMSIWIGASKDGFRVPLRRPLPDKAEVRSLRLVETRKGRMQIRNRKLSLIQYEAHISVHYAEAAPVVAPESLLDIVGVRIRKQWTTSDGSFYQNDGPHACNCPPPKPVENGRPERFRHSGRCGLAKPRRLQERIVAKLGGSARRRASKRRRKLERRRRELLRMRTADRARVFTAYAQDLLDKRQHPVRMVAVEDLPRMALITSAKGGTKHPGQKVRQRSNINRSMAESAGGEAVKILVREATKRGIPLVRVNPRDSLRSCSNCESVGDEPRKNQARFECTACSWQGNAAINACAVLAIRAYRQQVDPTAAMEPPSTGGPEQPS